MDSAPRILIVSHHFYPSGAIGAKRMSEFALFLMENGIDVKVLCASNHERSPHADLASRISGVDRTEIWAPRPIVDRLLAMLVRKKAQRHSRLRHEENTDVVKMGGWRESTTHWRKHYRSAEKLFDRNKLWSVFAAVTGVLLRLRRRYDVVISTGPPMSSHLAAMLIAKVHKAAWIADYRDPWMDNHRMTAEDVTNWRLRIETAAQSACTRNCFHIVCASPGIVEQVTQGNQEYAKKCTVITNGFDWRLPPKTNDGRLRLLYAGSLNLNRDPFPFFRAVANMISNPNVDRRKVNVIFVGNCETYSGVPTREWLNRHSLQDVIEIRPPVATEALKSLTAESDVLVNFAQGQPNQIPGKTFECIGASRISLVITESNSVTAKVICESESGIVVPPGDEEELSRVLQELYHRYVRLGKSFIPDEPRIEKFSRQLKNNSLLDIARSGIERRKVDIEH